jgi:hypothetical protein
MPKNSGEEEERDDAPPVACRRGRGGTIQAGGRPRRLRGGLVKDGGGMALEGVDLEIGGVDCRVRDSGWLGREIWERTERCR